MTSEKIDQLIRIPAFQEKNYQLIRKPAIKGKN